jgi:hypothetical protein
MGIQELGLELVLMQWWVLFWAPVWLSILWRVRRQVNPRALFIGRNIAPYEARWIDRLLARWVRQPALSLLLPGASCSSQGTFGLRTPRGTGSL